MEEIQPELVEFSAFPIYSTAAVLGTSSVTFWPVGKFHPATSISFSTPFPMARVYPPRVHSTACIVTLVIKGPVSTR